MIGGSGLTQVLATGTNSATATSNAGGGGFGLSMSATLPLAKIEGGVTAEFDGTINDGTGLIRHCRRDEHGDRARIRGLGRVLRGHRLVVDGA